MSLRYCFEEDYVIKTLRKSKKNDLAVVDPDGIDDEIFIAAAKRGVHLYGYLNAGAIEKERSFYKKFEYLRLAEYDGWPGEYWIDPTDAAWKKHVINQAIKMKRMGFKGLYFDNVDIYYMALRGFKEENSTMVGKRSVPSADAVFRALLDIITTLVMDVGMIVMPNGGDIFVRRLVKDGYKNLIKTVNQESVLFKDNEHTSSADRKYFTDYLDWCKKQGFYIRGIEYCKKTYHIAQAKAYYKLHNWPGLYISKHSYLKGD